MQHSKTELPSAAVLEIQAIVKRHRRDGGALDVRAYPGFTQASVGIHLITPSRRYAAYVVCKPADIRETKRAVVAAVNILQRRYEQHH